MLNKHPMRDVWIILGMAAVVIIPAALVHSRILVPVWEMKSIPDPTPLAYTFSLLLFIVPVVVIAIWHYFKGDHYDRRAFLWCAALMTTLGVVLDLAFGYSFFQFPNQGATMGLRVPSWDWANMTPVMDYLPVEEFGFYILGSLFMVAVYIWADNNWLQGHDREDYRAHARSQDRILRISLPAFLVWLGLLGYGVVHKYVLNMGFPEYYIFLMVCGVLPSLVLIQTVKQFVNWKALGFTFGALVLVSIMWEATWGVPYEWWIYRPERMLGWHFPAWGNLPVEAVILWLIGVWDAVMFYEFFRIRGHMDDRKMSEALFGTSSQT